MRTRGRAQPLEVVLDRRARVRRSNEYDLGNADLLLAVPDLDAADVAIEIDGGGFDVNGVAGIESGAILWPGDDQARLGDAIIADEYGGAFVRGIDVEIDARGSAWPVCREWTRQTIRHLRHH